SCFRLRNIIERDVENRNSRRDIAMKRKHLYVIAPPRYRFAAASQLQTHEIVDWAGRTVFAGNPLRIEEGQRPRPHRNREFAVNNIPGRVGGIDVERHCCLSKSRDTNEKQNDRDATGSNRFHGPIEPRTVLVEQIGPRLLRSTWIFWMTFRYF